MSDFEPISGYSKNRTSTIFSNGSDEQRAEFTYGMGNEWAPVSYDRERTSVLLVNGSDEQRAVAVYNLGGAQPVAEMGRYLSNWNAATGLAVSNPQENPYVYKTGDYYIVSVVASSGNNNYCPNGSTYVIGQASTTVESSHLAVNDTYLYDGENWLLLKTSDAVTSINGETGDVTITIDELLPTQTGQDGKVLQTNGSAATWETPTTITFRTWGANE